MNGPVPTIIHFQSFRLDLENETLWQANRRLPLRPRTFAMLRHLTRRAGRLVTKAELLDVVWPDTHVSDAVLKVCIGEIRRALGDDPKRPAIIETLHGRGYRFIAHVSPEQQLPRSDSTTSCSPQDSALGAPLGREAELRRLSGFFERAKAGERQLVFITGDVGMGKTTVAEALLRHCRAMGAITAIGQCIEQYGVVQPFLPLIEALGRLCRQPEGKVVKTSLSQLAPAWLSHVGGSAGATTANPLESFVAPEAALWPLAAALEASTRGVTIVLLLEDLQWADHATIDFLSLWAQRPEPARLLLVGTYRPVELITRDHPLRTLERELELKHRCTELRLEPLTGGAVRAYVAARYPTAVFPARFVSWLLERTGGQPLFLVNTLDFLAARELLRRTDDGWQLEPGFERADIPETLRNLIGQQVGRLPPELQHALQVSSVAGAEFSAAAVAAALAADLVSVEARCDELARHGQFLNARGAAEWPDGTVAGRYGWTHLLYREVVYRSIPPARQAHLHRLIGERIELAHSQGSGDVAAELAAHFEQCRDAPRAVRYLEQVAGAAARHAAHRDAIACLQRALALLPNIPERDARARIELSLQIMLGASLIVVLESYPAVAAVFERAQSLAEDLSDESGLLPALFGAWTIQIARGQYETASQIAEQSMTLALRRNDPLSFARAHRALAVTLWWRGHFGPAAEHVAKSEAHVALESYAADSAPYNPDYTGMCGALTLWFLGHFDRAQQLVSAAIARARRLPTDDRLGWSLAWAAAFQYLQRDPDCILAFATDALRCVLPGAIAPWAAPATVLLGWALMQKGDPESGRERTESGFATWLGTGALSGTSFFAAVKAETDVALGKFEDAVKTLDSALAALEDSDERVFEAEIHRLKGVVLEAEGSAKGAKRSHAHPEAEACFVRALEIARRQGAKALELRAAVSLSRLRARQGRRREARELIASIYAQFTESHSAADLREASLLLDQLS